MNNISSYALPIFTVLVIVFGLIKKIDIFNVFVDGAKKGFSVFLSVLPSLTALFLAIEMLKTSAGIEILTKILSPVGKLFNIPDEVLPMCILSPVSGGGSLSLFNTIISDYGPIHMWAE